MIVPQIINIINNITGRSLIFFRKKITFTTLFNPNRIEEITMPSLIPNIEVNTGININDPPNPQEAETRKDKKIIIAINKDMVGSLSFYKTGLLPFKTATRGLFS